MKAWEALQPGKLHLLVFGPDYGETVMVREPEGAWIVVDSLARSVGGRRWIPAVETLRALRERWGCVILTHRHQDHAAGLAEVLEAPGSGPVGCAEAMELDADWAELEDAEAQVAAGEKEDALTAIATRWLQDPGSRWVLGAGAKKTIGAVTVDPLYPRHPPAARLPTDKNRRASPVLVSWGATRLLLGSDLPAAGWRDLAPGVSPIAHEGYKVAHHASKGAHVASAHAPRGASVWVATPYSKARKLPRFEDGEGVARILQSVEALHLTGVPFALAPRGPWKRRDLLRQHKRVKVADDVVFEVTGARAAVDEHWVRATFDDDGRLLDIQHGTGAVVVHA